jgi:hypothetical protein
VSASSLSAALRDAGVACEVDARDGLAVITAKSGHERFGDENLRRRVLALAREHGFTHAAIELAAPAPEHGAAVHRD